MSILREKIKAKNLKRIKIWKIQIEGKHTKFEDFINKNNGWVEERWGNPNIPVPRFIIILGSQENLFFKMIFWAPTQMRAEAAVKKWIETESIFKKVHKRGKI